MDAGIPGVRHTRLTVHGDERGSFAELVRASNYPDPFVQSNHSRSKRHVLRGLHYHRKQADLWYVISGRAQVGLADLRATSGPPRTATVLLDGDEPATLYIPPGVAHGYLAMTDLDLIYWVTTEYDSSDEYGIAWDDPTLGLSWETSIPTLSERDQNNPKLDRNEIHWS